MLNNSNILFSKLDEFISKYYKNKIIKGLYISLLILLSYFIVISLLEYFSYFSIPVRTFIFYTSIVLLVFVLLFYIVQPFLNLYRIGRILSYEKAALIIAQYFPQISDKLQNTIELIKMSENDFNQLIIASINQRIETIKPIPFPLAINVRSKLKYLYIIFSILVFICPVLIFYPSVITDGATRIIKHKDYFEPQMPFHFHLENSSMKIEKGADYTFNLKITGDYIPSNVEISVGSTVYYMQKQSPSTFTFTLKEINNSIDFVFKADEYSSKPYHLQVIPSPQIRSFTLTSIVPEYTSEKNQTLHNVGDISVPEGSILKWQIATADVDQLSLLLGDSYVLKSTNNNGFECSLKVTKSTKYTVLATNPYIKNKALISYSITSIPDLFPTIDVSVKADSSNMFQNYFNGTIKDDYGFSKLLFVYYTSNRKDSLKHIEIQIDKSASNQDFFLGFDFSSFKKGDNVQYYFEVFDNDQIHHPKSTKSSVFSMKIPSKSEMEKMESQLSKNIENDFKSSLKITKELKNEIESIKQKLLNQEVTQWEKQQLLKQLQQKQEQLTQMVNKIAEQTQKKNDLQNNSDEKSQELLEKQKQLEELMKSVMDDELKKLMDEYQKMMQQFDKDKFFDMSNDMKLSLEDLEKQLDKNLELLKRMDLEKNINSIANDLKDLKKQQEQLSDKASEKSQSKDDIAKQQNDLNQKFGDLKKKYDEALDKNNSLDKKMNLNSFEKEFNDISQSMQKSENQMKEGSKSKSQNQMRNSSEKMDQLSELMTAMMQNNSQKQNAEDESQLRQILDNLLTLSFDQESLFKAVKKVQNSDPNYIKYLNTQLGFIDAFSIIKDSLYSLAKRQPAINKPVTEQVLNIEKSFSKIKRAFDDRSTSYIVINQQMVMTSLNNLALLLSEILQNMQNQQMSNNQNSSSQCKNPKKGKGSKSQSLSDIKMQQQSMKQQLQQMISQMKAGQKANQMSKQLGKMLSEQEKYEKMINDLIKDGTFSPEATQKLNEVKQLIDQNQKDIINKSINNQTINRQNQILTRLLEAENADKERETDKKRESKQGNQTLTSNPVLNLKYKNNNKSYSETLKYDNIKLQNFYKKKFEMYLINMNTR